MPEPSPHPNDPLRDAWRAARRLDDDPTPSPALRARILAEARRGRDGFVEGSPGEQHRRAPANDVRWRIPAIASVAAMGLAAMLAWQLRHGTPGEPELAGTPPSAPVATTAAPASDVPPDRTTRSAQPGTRREQLASIDSRDPETHQARARTSSESAMAAMPAMPASTAESTSKMAQARAAPPAQALVAASANGDLDAMRRALADGAAIDAPDVRGHTPLVAAVRARHIAAVNLLLEAGADPNRADRDGVTPLQQARSRDDTAIADLLIAAGAR